MVFDQRSYHWGGDETTQVHSSEWWPPSGFAKPWKGKGFTKWFPTKFEFWKMRLVQPYTCRIFLHPKLEIKSTSIIQ